MIRYPLTTVFSKTSSGTATAQNTFTLPNYDVDGLVAKFTAATFSADASAYCIIAVQTSPDYGTTFYDVAACKVTGTITAANAEFANIPVNFGSALYISRPSAGSLTASGVTGLPFLSNTGRVVFTFTNSNTATANVTCELLANNQSGGQY